MRLQCDTLSTMNFFSRLVKLRLQIGSNRIFIHGFVLTHKEWADESIQAIYFEDDAEEESARVVT